MKYINRLKNYPTYRYTVPIILFALLWLKGFYRFRHARIWAEDGVVFLKQAFEMGWLSLFESHAGYFHTIPRIIILVSTWFPIKIIPHFIVIVNYILFILIITTLLKKQYQWLFSSNLYAILAVVLLFFSPGQFEMLGNVTNLHWYLLLWLAILGLKDLNLPYTFVELVLIFLCITSEGASIILLPLFGTRLFLKLKFTHQNKFEHLIGEIYIITLILVFTIINIVIKTTHSTTSFTFDQLKIFYLHFVDFLLVHPFAGDYLLMQLQSSQITLALLGVIIMSYLSFIWYQNWKKEHILLVVLVLCSLSLPVMISLVRYENAEVLQSFFDFRFHRWFQYRYSFFIPAIAGVLWVFILQFVPKIKWLPKFLLMIILFSQIMLNPHRFIISEYGRENDWGDKAAVLEKSLSTGYPEEITIKIYPRNWEVTIKSKKKK